MKLSQIQKKLRLQTFIPSPNEDVEIEHGYVSDLLSDVIGNATANGLWVTIHAHPNIVAVAVLLEFPIVILANNVQPDDLTMEKAQKEGVGIYGSSLNAFSLIGKLYALGINGKTRWEARDNGR